MEMDNLATQSTPPVEIPAASAASGAATEHNPASPGARTGTAITAASDTQAGSAPNTASGDAAAVHTTAAPGSPDYPFEFSVVMAVYNVAPFLDEAVESLISQDFGFEHIQLIMVDDGSTDGSGDICDKYAAAYPENVTVIHKENGGVAAARNTGLEHARGRYINFLDADDKFSANTFRIVHAFYERHDSETDIVSVKMVFFDGASGQHMLNDKFRKGTRVIDLYREPNYMQLASNCTFIRSEALSGHRFDTQLKYAEDAKLINQILVDGHGTLGVVKKPVYWYRKRTTGESSAIQNSGKTRDYYYYYAHFFLCGLIDYSLDKKGYIPMFIQNTLAYDLQWRVKIDHIPAGLMTDEETAKYKEDLAYTLRHIDDRVIMALKYCFVEHKLYMLRLKYGRWPEMDARPGNVLAHYENTNAGVLSDNQTKLEFITIHGGVLEIEGFMAVLGVPEDEPLEIYVKSARTGTQDTVTAIQSAPASISVITPDFAPDSAPDSALSVAGMPNKSNESDNAANLSAAPSAAETVSITAEAAATAALSPAENLIPCELVERPKLVKYCLGDYAMLKVGFRARIPLDPDAQHYSLSLVLRLRGTDIPRKKIQLGGFSPISTEYPCSYYFNEDWAVQLSRGTLWVSRCGRKGHIGREIKFLREVWRKNKLGGRKAVLGRIACHLLKYFKRKPLWLVSDRIVKADDNGEAFFTYINKEHKDEIDSYFVIGKDSPDHDRMKRIGKVVDNLSWKHKLLFLLCDYNISAQADAITNNPFTGYSGALWDILHNKKFIFLQHGITKDNISDWLNRYNKNIYGFITAAHAEWESIAGNKLDYGYDAERIWLTGFPRFDRLYHDEQHMITIMPTWREYLMSFVHKDTGIWELAPGFSGSEYRAFYNGLLSDRRLLDAADRLGYHVCFLPHPTLQAHLDEFDLDSRVSVLGFDTKYRDVYARSDLVMTDYSSAVFDFAYLRKPIVYCQFDKEEFFSNHMYSKGYFDYERDGFGEVEYDLDSTINRIIEYMENGCRLKDKYRERIDGFFAFNDKNNCQRVYNRIMELEGKPVHTVE